MDKSCYSDGPGARTELTVDVAYLLKSETPFGMPQRPAINIIANNAFGSLVLSLNYQSVRMTRKNPQIRLIMTIED
ncbi:hypothetical protein L210DRAFT_940923 [Boletus edulis BED1]|uniref:Uncharacterized protein n=1 Tax=Boletus edulis BED1 TaxID=1328754 RepID=A0AAD4GDS9_BOLED|nr:hypothetical protein L210DRAFT_940923 [Boletus edulis BED1]